MPGEEEKDLTQKSEEETGYVKVKEEDYTKMVTNMGEMQKTIEQMMERESRRDQLAQDAESRRAQESTPPGPQAPVDLNELDNNQLAQFLTQHIHQTMGEPLLKMVATQTVREERKELREHMKSQGEKPEDIEKNEKEILELVMKRPQLSLLEGYKLLKSERPTQKSENPEDKKEEKKPPKGFAGEKPGGSRSQFTPSGKMSLDDAVAKALEGYQET